MLKLEVIGNLGADAEVRYANGNKFVTMRVCHSEKRNGAEISTWVSVAWSGEHDNVLPYLTKGTRVFIRGNLDVRVFLASNGTYQAGLNLSAREVEFFSAKKEQGPDLAVPPEEDAAF